MSGEMAPNCPQKTQLYQAVTVVFVIAHFITVLNYKQSQQM